MLVFRDPRVGYFAVRIVHDSRTLIIAFCSDHLEVQRAIAEATKIEVEIAIDWPGIEDMVEVLGQILRSAAGLQFD